MAFFPFLLVFLGFCVVFCLRKVNDVFMLSTIWLLMISMALRMVINVILFILWYDMEKNFDSVDILEMKMSVFEFTLPVYFF
mmetsp:Transcript_20893/g.25659  ORF Transcript_20893/g.25659 Transcript_20893/m.25659 type:complete len:82 (+) Transcript_20893:224-469(+)